VPRLAPPDRPLTDGVVTLRAWRREDRDAVVAALQDEEIARWTSVPSPYRPADFDGWMAAQVEQRAAGTGVHCLVVDPENRLLGSAGVQLTEAVPDIGYWCVREHRGRGYTTRAVRLLAKHVLALGFRRVDILVHADNAPSQRVAEAAGFQRQPGLTTVARLGGGHVFVRFTRSETP
jgi:RimJ/RimL family protein N-acetyltransferase